MNKKYIAIIFYITAILINKSYNRLYPTLAIYPNSEKEINIVKQKISTRTNKQLQLFYLTNVSTAYAFLPYVNESINELIKISTSQNYIILFFKYLINRIRPWQIDTTIKPVNISTAKTPAYPAGHAYQAFLLADYLTKKYPNKKDLFYKIAIDCDDCRINTGLHYPSDGIFSRKLYRLFNNSSI